MLSGRRSARAFPPPRRASPCVTSRSSRTGPPSRATRRSWPARFNSELGGTMSARDLELDDIQGGVLRPRPTPFAATYVVLRIDEPKVGRELMRRLSTVV